MSDAVLTHSLMRSLSVFRWATLAGAWVGLWLSREHLIHPAVAVGLLAAATVLTGWLGVMDRLDRSLLASPAVLGLEVALGVTLLLADGWVYNTDRAQSLPWAWPAAGIAAVGIARGGQIALAVAALVATASLITEVIVLDRFSGAAQLPLALSKIGLWLLVGGIAGPLTDRLRRAERLISLARTREEVGRQLHDGVLQTLAVVQRRSDDAELVSLARDQEQSLRSYLSDERLGPPELDEPGASAEIAQAPTLEAALRTAACRVERLYPLSASVIVAADCQALPAGSIEAVQGAVSEAGINAAKHGGATTITIYAEPADEELWTVAVSVKDNGAGFDPAAMTAGVGWSRSIRGRIDEVGGRVDVVSSPGRGAEVRLWV